MRLRHLAAAAVALLALAACGGSPPSPITPSKPPSPPTLEVSCTASPGLVCSASLYGEGDITAQSLVVRGGVVPSEDLPVTASPDVVFRSPGVPTALRAQNVYIRADYDSPTWAPMRNIAPHAFAIDPGGSAVPLAYLAGQVFTGGIPGNGTVGGATVEITEGEGAGRRAVTLDNGYYMLEFLRLDAPFTARASKTGYTTDVRAHPGIVDNSDGYPMNQSLHFTIEPR